MGYPTTLMGKAMYTYAFSPDTGFGQNQYSIQLRLGGEDAVKLQGQVDELLSASHKKYSEEMAGKKVKKASPPYKEVTNEDGTPTGQLEFKFKQNATIDTKNGPMDMKPAVFDAKGKPITEPVKVGNGSSVKVAYEPYLWYSASQGAGVKLRFKALQIIDLKEVTGGNNADGYGFGEEDGYSHENNNNNGGGDDEAEEFFPETPDNEEEDF